VRLDKDEPLYESLIREDRQLKQQRTQKTWSENAEKGMYFTCRICALSICQSVFWWPGDFSKFCVFLQFIKTHGIHTQKVTCKFSV